MSEPTAPSQQAQPTPRAQSGFESKLARFVNNVAIGIARHWLALFNFAFGLYVFLPLLAPILMQMGYGLPARGIYGVYSFLCHQLPDHSYFLFGANTAPHLHELEAAGMQPGLSLLGQRRFIGNLEAGYKTALCQRDLAIYGSVFLAGIVYAMFRGRIKSPGIKLYLLLFVLPMAIDGVSQMVGLRDSNWVLRSITGALFGAGTVWLAYPYVDDAMQDVVETEEQRLAQLYPPRPD